MKKLGIILLTAVLFWTLFSGCAVSRKNVLYFGYFNGDEEYLLTDIKQADNSNIVFIEDVGALQYAWETHISVIYKIPAALFEANGSALNVRWEEIYEKYYLPVLSTYRNLIFGFCIAQTYTNGMSADQLLLLTQRLRQDFPGCKIILQEDSASIAGIADYAKNADIIMAEFLQTPTSADIQSAVDQTGSTPLWLKISHDANAVYKNAINVQGIVIADARTINDDQILIGQDVLKNGALPKSVSNAKYFGYYHSSGFAGSRDFFDEIGAMGNSNIAFVEKRTDQQFEACLSNNMQPIVYFTDLILHTYTYNTPEWEDAYARFRASIDSHIDDIYAFYADEPLWNNTPKELFRSVTQRLRQDYPEKRVMAVLALNSVHKDNADYFEFCTDLGYDTYKPWNLPQRLKEFQMLKDVAAFGQDLWLITWSCSCYNAYSQEFEETYIADIVNNYILSEYEPRVVGILNFTYPSDDVGNWPGDWNEGFRDLIKIMPKLYQTHLEIGKKVIANGR